MEDSNYEQGSENGVLKKILTVSLCFVYDWVGQPESSQV
jgi:hypothetical protein